MKQKPFRLKLYLMFASILIVIVLVFSLVLYENAKQQTIQSAARALEANTQQMAYLLDNVIRQMDTLSLQLTAATDLQEYFRNSLEASIVNPEFERVINKAAAQFILSFEYNARITIYCPDCSYSSIGIPVNSRIMSNFFRSDGFQDWYKQRNSFSGYTNLLPPQEDPWSNTNMSYISFARQLNHSVSFEQVGLIEIQIPQATFQKIAASIGASNCQYYLVNQNNDLFLSSDSGSEISINLLLQEFQSYNTSTFLLRNKSLVSAKKLDYSGLTLVQVQLISDAANVLDSFGSTMILICIALILFFLVFVFFVIRAMTRPLHDLQQAISEISPIHTGSSRDEFSWMQMSFFSLKERLNTAISEAVEAKTRQEHAQFVALQAQIDPHFTFNAISVIAAAALSNGDLQIYDIASSFSDMLRYILSDPAETVSFATELAHCEAYLNIMKYRYEDQLSVDFTYPDTIKMLPLPKLSLQPLLENCFKHGFDKTLPPYDIGLHVSTQKNRVSITVQDNGSGVSPERLMKLNDSLSQTSGTITRGHSLGLGLRSTYLRMKQLYPDAHMELQALQGKGLTVVITLPVQDTHLLHSGAAVQEGSF